MDERGVPATDAAMVSAAYGAARELLRQAEEDAARIRVEADRYRRQREQEAELLVGKARRLLEMAEERAAAPKPAAVDLDTPVATQAWDLDAPVERDPDETARPVTTGARNALDSIVATAVSNAIHRALPSDR